MKIVAKLNYVFCIVLLFALQSNAYAKNSDHTLGGLINTALNYHPSIKASARLESASEQEVDIAEWQYFPTPSLSVSQVKASKTDVNFNGDNRVITLGLTQPLWTGGSLSADLKRAQAELEIKKSQSSVVKRDLVLRLVNSYSVWLASYLKLEAYQSSQKEHQLLQERIKRRIEQGLSSSSDLALVSSRLLQAEANLNSAKIRHKNAFLQLQEVVGRELNSKDMIANISADYPIQGELQPLLANALIIDPKLIESRAKIKSLRAAYKASEARFQPAINLKLERQWGNFNSKNTKTENRVFIDMVSRFGAGLSNFSNARKAKFEAQSSEFEIESVRDSIKQRFEGEWLSRKSLIKQKKVLSEALISSKKIQQSWYRQFLAGRKQWQDVMNSIREVSQLESQLADTIAESLLVTWRLGIRIDGALKLARYHTPSKLLIKTSNEKLLDNDSLTVTPKKGAALDKTKYVKPAIAEVEASKPIVAIKKVKRSADTKKTTVSATIVEKAEAIIPKKVTTKADLKTHKNDANRVVWRSKKAYRPQSLDLINKPFKVKIVKPFENKVVKPKTRIKIQILEGKKTHNEKTQRKMLWKRYY